MEKEIERLEKRIILLLSTIEAYKGINETNDKLIEAIKYGHELEIQLYYTKNK